MQLGVGASDSHAGCSDIYPQLSLGACKRLPPGPATLLESLPPGFKAVVGSYLLLQAAGEGATAGLGYR